MNLDDAHTNAYWGMLGASLTLGGGVLLHSYKTDLVVPRDLQRPAKGAKAAKLRSHFLSFRQVFLMGFAAMSLGDWLQGPYLVPMYTAFNYTTSDIAVLFALDYATAAVLVALAGAVTDTVGAKLGCVGYGLIYAVACLCNHWPDTFPVMMLGVLLDGVCNALLRMCFESYVSEYSQAEGFAEDWSAHLMAASTWLGTVLSVLAGILCYGMVVAASSASVELPWAGLDSSVVTMDAAAALLVCAACYTALKWPSTKKGSAKNEKETADTTKDEAMLSVQALLLSVKDAAEYVASAPRAVVADAALEVAMEAALLLFIAVYPFAMLAVDPAAPAGVVFSTLVSGIPIGCAAFNAINSSEFLKQTKGSGRTDPTRQLLGACCAASCIAAAVVVWAITSPELQDGGLDRSWAVMAVTGSLWVMEVVFGVYYPALGAVHDSYADLAAESGSQAGRNAIVGCVRTVAYLVALAGLAVLAWFGASAAWVVVCVLFGGAACFGLLFKDTDKK